jgi:hypothetical protein
MEDTFVKEDKSWHGLDACGLGNVLYTQRSTTIRDEACSIVQRKCVGYLIFIDVNFEEDG